MTIAQLKHALAGPVLITGGAGFIGSNLANALLEEGREVIIFDNLSRKGVEQNLHWLSSRHGKRLIFRSGDLRDKAAVTAAVASASAVAHLAAQVAVTASLDDPWEDFTVNMLGTMHLLEAMRRKGSRMPLVFASTNKVYGDLGGLKTTVNDQRHVPRDREIARTRYQRGDGARLRHALWLLQGCGGPICSRLCQKLRNSGGGASNELHLRAASIRHRGPGLGRPFSAARARRRHADGLWRWTAGSRRPACP